MKKILILMMAVIAWLPSFAKDPARLSVNAGVFAPYTLDATIGYEKPVGFGHAFNIFAEAGNHWQTPVCHMFWKKYFWDGGVEYKHKISRGKNSTFRFISGVYCGEWIHDFYFGCHLGFEYAYTFANNWQFTVTQKNRFNFLHGSDLFQNGLMIGVKIPM